MALFYKVTQKSCAAAHRFMKRSFASESLLLSYSMTPLLSLAFSSDTGLECSVPSHDAGSSKSPVLHGFSNVWSEVAAVVSFGSGSANVNNCVSGTLWQSQAECSKGLLEYEPQERTSSSGQPHLWHKTAPRVEAVNTDCLLHPG